MSLAAKSTPPNLTACRTQGRNGKRRHSLIHKATLLYIPTAYHVCQQSCAPSSLDGGGDTKMRSTHKLEARPQRRTPHSVGSKEKQKANDDIDFSRAVQRWRNLRRPVRRQRTQNIS